MLPRSGALQTGVSFTIGIVCSGNTCRSPILAAWLRERLSIVRKGCIVHVWTAGLHVGKQKKVPKMVRDIALQMGLSRRLITELREHRARDLFDVDEPTDLLVWITDRKKVNLIQNGVTRGELMRHAAKVRGAVLLFILEADKPWDAKKRKPPASNKRLEHLYRQQATSLKQWASIIEGCIPKRLLRA